MQDKTAKLPIEHLAKKIGFDHFITFNFPEELTANGFAISMNNLLSYLEQNNFVTVLSAFSTGATLMAEWLLSAINNKDFKNLSIFSEKITRVIMAGGLFEPKDLERKAYLAGKYLIKFPERIIKRLPLINRNPFIKRAGGAKEMFYRVKYLFSIRNKEIIEKMSEQEWINAGEIFKKNQDFQLIFLADTGQRIVLPSGAGKWYQVMYKNLGSQVKGLVAKNVEKGWIDYPVSKHEEVKNLWTLLSLIGTSPNLRKDLNFSLMSTQIADEWPKYRFIHMARGPI